MPTEHPATRCLYSWDHVHAAMCIWEEMVDTAQQSTPWREMREQQGALQMRDWVITILAPAADEAWERAQHQFETDYAAWDAKRAAEGPHSGQRAEFEAWLVDNPQPEDPGGYDWEFVPMWLRLAIDWSGQQPVVKASTKTPENVS